MDHTRRKLIKTLLIVLIISLRSRGSYLNPNKRMARNLSEVTNANISLKFEQTVNSNGRSSTAIIPQALRIFDINKDPICTGFPIPPNIILTVAHCLQNDKNVLKMSDIHFAFDNEDAVRLEGEIYILSQFDRIKKQNDFAIIKLHDLEFLSNRTIMMELTLFGDDRSQSNNCLVLTTRSSPVFVEILAKDKCQKTLETIKKSSTGVICAINQIGLPGIIPGDSGSILLCPENSGSNNPQFGLRGIGVLSYADATYANNSTYVFTDITYYETWINYIRITSYNLAVVNNVLIVFLQNATTFALLILVSVCTICFNVGIGLGFVRLERNF